MSGFRKNMLKESAINMALPDDVKQSILQNRTSLGNNPAIPDIFDVPYLMKAMTNQFKSICEEVSEIGLAESENIDGTLAKLINRCKKLETPFRSELEKTCLNYVIDLFGIPEDAIDFKIELVDEVDTSGSAILLDPFDGDGDEQFEDVDDAKSIRAEVYKRRFLDAACMGAGLYVSENIDDSIIEDVETICPELVELYNKVMILNRYALFMKEDIGMDDRNKLQLGTVEVFLGNGDEKIVIHSQGVIMPVLLCETVRGLFELFISHGLPERMEIANIVLHKADYLKAEPWDMRIGPHIWNMLSRSFNDVTFEDMPYLFKRISSLDIDKFNFLMKEILAGTKKGRAIMSKICNKAKDDEEYDKFVDRMDKMKKNHGIITDDYIHADEL